VSYITSVKEFAMMDHEQAIQEHASMRYALGELAPADRDAFEGHFADCSFCMKDVEASTAFAANARQLFRERAAVRTPAKGFSWFQWRPFPAFALSAAFNVVLLAGLGYEMVHLHPAAPAAVADSDGAQNVEIVPIHAITRGSEHLPVVPASRASIVLAFDLLQSYEHYRYSVERAGSSVMSGELTVAGRPDSLNLQIPVARLSPGEYRVTVTGTEGSAQENVGACLLQVGAK
jgi:hypothetical protein